MTAPPSPREPAFLHRVRYLRDPLGYLDECQRRLGDVFTLRLIKQGMVFVCAPELAREVYTADDDVLAAGAAKIAMFGKILGRSSSLLLDGDAHLVRRRLLLPPFRGEAMHAFHTVIVAASDRMIDAMLRERSFALHPLMHQLAFDVIARALFSDTPPDRLDRLLEALRAFANQAVTSRWLMIPALQVDLGPLSPWGRVLRVVAQARAVVLDELVRRQGAGRALHDITGLLLSARHEDGAPLTQTELCDEILTMVAAGHETTAMALTWLCYAVFTRPAVVDRLVDELASTPVGGGGDAGDVESLAYLDAVVRESLRFHSVVPNGSGRMVRKPFRLGGYDVPVGSMITVAFHSVHRRAGVFDRADEFLPERFLTAKYTPYESVPFGGGTRRCLGMPFALFEIKVVLATLLRRLRLDVTQRRVKPTWRGAFLTPSRGLGVRVARDHP